MQVHCKQHVHNQKGFPATLATSIYGSWLCARQNSACSCLVVCHTCRGTLPDTLSNLSKLQWLLLDNNQLAGLLPGYLGSMPNLKQAQLQGNNLSGPVPTEWCSSQAVFDISNNPYLCGEQALLAGIGAASMRLRPSTGLWDTPAAVKPGLGIKAISSCIGQQKVYAEIACVVCWAGHRRYA